jgi:hypothetical protein
MTGLPAPLTPPDCVLRDFQFMPMDVQRLLKSDTWVLGSGDERAAAMTLWLESWHQVPAGSLPKQDKMLAPPFPGQFEVEKGQGTRFARLVGSVRRTTLSRSRRRKSFGSVDRKLSNSISGANGNAKRWGVDIDTRQVREQFSLAVSMLHDIAPQSKTLKKKIVVTFGMGSPPESPPERDLLSPPESSGDRKGQGQGQGLLTTKASGSGESTVHGREHARAVAPLPLPMRETPPLSDDPAVQISVMLRRLNVDAPFTHPAVIDWASAGIPHEVLQAAVEKARKRRGKADVELHANYLVGIVHDILNPPEKATTPAAPPSTWQNSAKGIERKGKSIGLEQGPNELIRDYAARIQAELDRRQGASP